MRIATRSTSGLADEHRASIAVSQLTQEENTVPQTRPAAHRAVLALIAALVATLAIIPAAASAKNTREVKVMTQNLYLGSSLDPALAADDLTEFVTAVATIYGTVQFTDFPARAEAIADEIAAQQPDLIGLQEVTKWTTAGPGAPAGYDFLEILQDELQERGLNYTAAATADNADIGPAPLALGPGCPVLAGPTFTCSVRLQDRDVILVNDDTPGLTWSAPQSGRFTAQTVFNSPAGPLSFDRGWASIKARLNNKPFTFVNTHLETEADPPTQQAQAAEFLNGPAKGGTVIATGDFNSAADGSTTTSYAQLTAPGRFRDAWDESALGAGYTCCQNSTLTNFPSALGSRIDLILSRASARATGDAVVVGANPFQGVPPLYPADHAGVVATVKLNG